MTEESKTTPFCQDHDRDSEEILSSRTDGEGRRIKGNESNETEEDESSDTHEGNRATDGKSNASLDEGSNSTNDGNGRTDEKSNGSDKGGSKSEEGSSGTPKRLFKPRSTVRASRAAVDPSPKKEVAMWLRSFYTISN